MNVDVGFNSNVNINFNQPGPSVEGATGNIDVPWATPDIPQFNNSSNPPASNCFVMSHGNQSSKSSSPSQEVR